MARSVPVVLGFGLLMIVGSAFSASQSGAEPVQDHLVLGLSGAALAAAGFEVIDDYGGMATARLSADDAASLRAQGLAVSPLEYTSGRGAYRYDLTDSGVVPEDLRASDAAPYAIVQFRGPIKADWLSTLETYSLDVLDYLPNFAFLVRLDAAQANLLSGFGEVRAVTPYHPGFKLAPELPTYGTLDVTVLADLAVNVKDILDMLQAVGATPKAYATAQLEHVIDVSIDVANLAAVARLDPVLWIEPALDVGSLDNDRSSAITQGAAVGAWPLYDEGVDGSSQKVSICDTGANTASTLLTLPPLPAGLKPIRMQHEMHDDTPGLILYNEHLQAPELQGLFPHRKIDLYYSPQEAGNRGDSDDSDGHGTHTSGTLAGDKTPFGERNDFDGVAYGAKLLICDITNGAAFQILNDYSNYWQPAYDRGARINTNSWGSVHTNVYTEKARQHDAYVSTHRDFLILRSMGNTGAAGMIRPEAVAKSAMGIGATGNGLPGADTIAGFSTGGLTQDGRMKPNVAAPGDCLQSSYLNNANSYLCISGTSMSTPTTAGAAALVRDYFQKGYYPTGQANEPDAFGASAALVRATLQISGREIPGDRGEANFPNKAQGWGRVTLEDVLFFDGDARGLLVEDEGAGLNTGDVATTSLDVAAGQALRIMVAWSDAPGAAGANPAIVNDLNLVVTGPNGDVFRGNAFVGNQVPPNQGSPDNRNVEEAVYINAPIAGSYTIEVSGANVPSGPQSFVLLATGGLV